MLNHHWKQPVSQESSSHLRSVVDGCVGSKRGGRPGWGHEKLRWIHDRSVNGLICGLEICCEYFRNNNGDYWWIVQLDICVYIYVHIYIYTYICTHIWAIVKTREYLDMYWLDIGFQKMQKTEVSDGTFPNSDTPFWMLRIIFLECWFRKVLAAMIDLGSGWKGKEMERKGRKRNGKAKEKERKRIEK